MTVPTRNLHTQVRISVSEANLCRAVRSNWGKPWSTTAKGIYDYRAWLLAAQNYRCAYCQIPITSTRVGHCELDHILPKEPSKNFAANRVRAKSNRYEDRRHTNGYRRFRYVPENLAVSCKQCNSSKGSHDARADRSRSVIQYPAGVSEFLWVHPHLHVYSQHVAIDENWIYSHITPEGEETIKACGLRKPEVIARRKEADALHSQSADTEDFLIKLGSQIENIGLRDCVRVLVAKCNVTDAVASDIATLLWSAATPRRTLEKFSRAIEQSLALLPTENQPAPPKPSLPQESPHLPVL